MQRDRRPVRSSKVLSCSSAHSRVSFMSRTNATHDRPNGYRSDSYLVGNTPTRPDSYHVGKDSCLTPRRSRRTFPFEEKRLLKILYVTRVLFATDGSELAIEAAQRAAGMLADFEATVLGVLPPLLLPRVAGVESVDLPVTSPEIVAEIDESVTAQIEAGIERTITAIGRAAERRVVHGDPAIEICRVAEEGRFNLVVIGSHGSGFLKRVLLGSVSHHVLHHASCPVLVVRERDDG